MSKTYKNIVNDDYSFTLTDKEIQNLDILPKASNEYHLLEDNKTYHIKTSRQDFEAKKYLISVNGNPYEIEIKDRLDQLIEEMGLTVNDREKESNIKSPMPGLIIEIAVKVGDEVKEGDTLLVLEAMKMENMLAAPKDGIIKTVHVTKGDNVEKASLLIEME